MKSLGHGDSADQVQLSHLNLMEYITPIFKKEWSI